MIINWINANKKAEVAVIIKIKENSRQKDYTKSKWSFCIKKHLICDK